MISSTLKSESTALANLDTIFKPGSTFSQHKLLRIHSPIYSGLGVLLSYEGKNYRDISLALLKHIDHINESILELTISNISQKLLILMKANLINFPQLLDHSLEICEYIADFPVNEKYCSAINEINEANTSYGNSKKLRGGSMASKTTSISNSKSPYYNTVTKEIRGKDLVENGSEKLRSEIFHILTRENKVKNFFPDILEFTYSTLTKYTKVVMPCYFKSTDLSHIILDSSIPISSVKETYNSILSSLFSNFYITQKSTFPSEDYIEKLFFSRVQRRIQQIFNEFDSFSPELNKIIKEGFVLNGRDVPSLLTLINYIKKDRAAMERLTIKDVFESHHDLIASNILVDFCKDSLRLKDFKLIDCRGENEIGKSYRHWFYDLCKAKFFVSGYDLIRRDYFSQEIQKKSHKIHINFDFEPDSETVSRYQELNQSFFEIVETSDQTLRLVLSDPYWKEKICFGEGFMFIADIPPRIVDEGSQEMVIAFYVYGIQLLLEYIDKYVSIKEERII